MANESSGTEAPLDDWSVDSRGYIHGGFDTPIFQIAKKNHNSRLTNRRNKIKSTLRDNKNPQDSEETS